METARQRESTPPLILVVDDYCDGREVLVELLQAQGYRVAEAPDGVAALEKAVALRPDLILLDLALPDIDGWEVTRRLKADATTSAILIVAVTAHTLQVHANRAREAGCDDFITKPFQMDVLAKRISEMLASRDADQQP